MPCLEIINGVKIFIYNGEDMPPHIHAKYNEYEVLITIESKDIYAGSLPAKQLKVAFDWLSKNTEWSLQVFYELNPDFAK